MTKRFRAFSASVDSRFIERYQYWFLVAITFLAFLLRFFKLGEWSFWADEMLTIREAGAAFRGGLLLSDIPGKGLTLLLISRALSLLGTNEWSARLVPALVGIATIPILCLIARKLFNPAVGLGAALLLAVSPWHIEWSQNARYPASLLLLFSLAVFYLYLGLERDRPLLVLTSVFFFALAMWERFYAVFYIPIAFGYILLLILFRYRKPVGINRRNVGLLIGALSLYFLITPPAAIQHLTVSADFVGFEEFAGGGLYWPSPQSILWNYVNFITLPIVCLGGGALIYLFLKKERTSLVLGLGMAIPLLGTMVAALFQPAYVRYTFLSLPFVLILAASGLNALFERTSGAAKSITLGLLVLLILEPLISTGFYFRDRNGNRPDWKGAYEYVQQQRMPNDIILANQQVVGAYYIGEEVIDLREIDLEYLLALNQRGWVVTDTAWTRIDPAIQKWIGGNCNLIREKFNVLTYLCNP
jgi:mannosyltransferase